MSDAAESKARIPAPDPGIYPDIPFDTYLAWDATNASLLKAMERCPAYAHYQKMNPDPDKKEYVKGRLFHLLATGATNADEEFIVAPETYVADRGKDEGETKPWNGNAIVCQDWIAKRKASGMTIVAPDVHADASGMAESVRKHPKLGPLVAGAQVELSLVWVDLATGLTCKARMDMYKNGVICDLKSSSKRVWTADWQANPFFRSAYDLGYPIQCAHYIEGMQTLKMTDEVAWMVFGAVEGKAPYLTMAYDVHDDPDSQSYDFLLYGRIMRTLLMAEYKRCLDSGQWPAYPTEHEDMMLPYYGQKALEEIQGWQKG